MYVVKCMRMLFADLCRCPLTWMYRTCPSCRARLSSELRPQQCDKFCLFVPAPVSAALRAFSRLSSAVSFRGSTKICRPCAGTGTRHGKMSCAECRRLSVMRWRPTSRSSARRGCAPPMLRPRQLPCPHAHTRHSRGPQANTQDAVTLEIHDKIGRHISANLDLCWVAILQGYLI